MKKLLGLIFLFPAIGASSQQQADTVRALYLADLVWEMRFKEVDSAFYYAFEGLSLSRQLQYVPGIIENSLSLAECYRQAGSIETALNYANDALRNIRGEQLQKRYNDNVYNMLGLIYWTSEQYDLCLESFLKAYSFIENTHSDLSKTTLINNVGVGYMFKGEYDSAEVYFTKALSWNLELKNRDGIAYNHFNLGKIAYFRKKYQQALKFLEMAQTEAQQLGYRPLEASTLSQMSAVYRETNNPHTALRLSLQAVALALQAKSHLEKQTAYEAVYKSYLALDDFQNALKYRNLHISAKDSMNLFQQRLAREAYVKEHELAEKEQEVFALRQQGLKTEYELQLRSKQLQIQNIILVSIVLFTVLLLVVIVTQLRKSAIKKHFIAELTKKNEEIARQQSLTEKMNLQLSLSLNRAKVDPHFIFNVLNSVGSLVLEKKCHEASDHLGRVARLTRYVLDQSSNSIVTIAQEVEMLRLYLSLEQFRLDDNFDFRIDVQAPSQAIVPALLIQPYVENAILHGIAPVSAKGLLLRISFVEMGDLLEIQIVNNGKGKTMNSAVHQHSSHGLSLGAQRLKLLSAINEGEHYNVAVQELNVNCTDPTVEKYRVIIHVPLKMDANIKEHISV